MSDTILIVDDSSFIVDGLAAILKNRYRTLAAYSGEDCLAILHKEIPSVIILDVFMEPIDGWETLTRIKENPATRNIPVLMFSARKISPKEAEKHLIRIDDFIQKPVSPKKIIEAIEKVLTRRDAKRRVIEGWEASGVAHEKIEEYLTLTTNLEVDLSLCQNIRLQCDLAGPPGACPAEFQAVIEAIEQRIAQERSLVAALEEEMNTRQQAIGAVQKDREPGEPERMTAGELMAATSPVTEISGNPPPAADNTPDSAAEVEAGAVLPMETGAAPAATGIPGTLPASAGTETTLPTLPAAAEHPTGPLLEDALFEEPAGLPTLEEDLFDEPAGVPPLENPQSVQGGEESSLPLMDSLDQPGAAEEPPALDNPESSGDEQSLLAAAMAPEAADQNTGIADGEPTGSGNELPVTGGPSGIPDTISRAGDTAENRRLVPAELDLPPSLPEENLAGAGTDVLLPRERLRSRRKPADKVPPGSITPGPLQPGTEGGVGAKIARLISRFTRKNKP